MSILRLALLSLWNRRLTAALTILSIALSVALLLGVERLRSEARASFTNTISGTDLIVGARSGPVQLLLYAVFRIGNATNNITWQSYQAIAAHPKVAWSVPLSLGDSHRGFRVLGTTAEYFERLRFGRGATRGLHFSAGGPFVDLYDAVLGSAVAERLGYRVGTAIIIAHGAGDVQFARHDDQPFRVVGILAPTGTPVDRTVHVSLAAIEAIHVGWQGGAPLPGVRIGAEAARRMDLTPQAITAALIGLDARVHTFAVQRYVNDFRAEPLLAVLPGVALSELWSVVGVAENALRIVAWFVVLVGLIGMLTALLIGLEQRRRELAILRSVGARPPQLVLLITGEALFLTFVGCVLGVALLAGLFAVGAPLLEARFGIALGADAGAPLPLSAPAWVQGLAPLVAPVDWLIGWLGPVEWALLGAVLAAGLLVGLLPAWRAYRLSLADGLAVRV